MKKFIFLFILSSVIAVIGFAGYFGSTVFFLSASTPVQPERPSKVPAQAFWIGGIDGGHYISINPNSSYSDAFNVSVYTDYSGDIDFDGILQYQGEDDISNRWPDHTFFRYWDGELLHLSNGKAMKIIQENVISP